MSELPKTRDPGDAGTTVVLCATHRLARNLRLAHDRNQAARGLVRWQPLAAHTAFQWLESLLEDALLRGELAATAAPATVLSVVQERLLWERIVEADGDGAEAAFFDRAGLAAAAADANALIEVWGLRPGGDFGEETRRFLRWRGEFRRRCEREGWIEAARAVAWQIEAIAGGAGRLPPRVLFAGFDRYTPQELRVAAVLRARGCEVGELELGAASAAAAASVAVADRVAECRAAVAWAAGRLAVDPAARLGIVVPDLAALRAQLAALLDEALPAASAARRYNFSLGLALSRQPLVDAALRLLRLAAGASQVEQEAVGELLRGGYWSAEESEADRRARIEAELREALPPLFSFDRLLRYLRRHEEMAPRLLADLTALRERAAAANGRRLPSQWAAVLAELLVAAGWPGERGLDSHEFQARAAFDEVATGLAQFDGVLGRVGFGEAVSRLGRLCRERVFQPETEGDPPLQVVGPLEAAGMSFDALWVMGMNDDAWPAPPNPNPLLPAEWQRRAGTPGASSEVEAAFARSIHRRLLHSAPSAIFSWAQAEGDRPRRPSPLIAGLPPVAAPTPLPTLAERLCGTLPLERRRDDRAPPVAAAERVGGGSGLLKAQAICPAWAYYRYRLGARALGEPAEGLDALARGSLVHAVLEAFWKERSSAELADMVIAAREAAVAAAVASALARFDAERDEPLPPRVAALERERLQALTLAWLDMEEARQAPFRVVACEEKHEPTIAGLTIRLTVDRIDALEDGSRVVLDYKTGRVTDWSSWAADRIVEPQLPLYAAFIAGEDGVAAVVFARVRSGDEGFAGIAAAGELLPEVPGLNDKDGRRRFDETAFPDWPSVVAHWRAAIEAVAAEVRDGVAAVSFSDEKLLAHCEVRPLLRLAERRSQMDVMG